MLQFFVDDSGSSPDDSYFVLGGLAASVDRWEAFTDEWEEALQGERPLGYFKASEAYAQRGEFGHGWTRPLIDQKVDELASIASKHGQYRLHSVMKWSDYNQYIKDIAYDMLEPFAEELKNPYFLCLFSLMATVSAYTDAERLDPIREYILDEHGKIGQIADRVIRMISHDEELRKGMGGLPSFKNDKVVLPLQAADLTAWHIRDQITQGNRDIHVKRALFNLPSIGVVLTPPSCNK